MYPRARSRALAFNVARVSRDVGVPNLAVLWEARASVFLLAAAETLEDVRETEDAKHGAAADPRDNSDPKRRSHSPTTAGKNRCHTKRTRP
jgi:hypothetical protein